MSVTSAPPLPSHPFEFIHWYPQTYVVQCAGQAVKLNMCFLVLGISMMMISLHPSISSNEDICFNGQLLFDAIYLMQSLATEASHV